MTQSQRLPRRVRLGLNYAVEVVLATQKVIRDVMEVDEDDAAQFDGCWVSHLGENEVCHSLVRAGIIYVDQALSAKKRRETYWHELGHALLDVRDFDLG